jgi:DNA processing protein
LLSEFPFGRAPIPQQFVKRDSTQAGAALTYARWLAVPYPTDKDRKAAEPKIQANLVLAQGTPGDKAGLLHCAPEALDHLVILRSRDDYARMTAIATPSRPSPAPSQHALL